jgi:putative membrane protein
MNRLHPAMFAVMIVPFIQRFGVLFIVLFFTSRNNDMTISLGVLGFGLFISMMVSGAHYLTTTYGIVGEKLEFHTGWIWTRHKIIPIERIQSVHIEQNLVHRLFNVAAVRVDTGVTNKMEEVQIAAIDYGEAERLRHRLLQRVHIQSESGVPFEAPQIGPALFKLTVGELAMHGFAHNRWIYVVGAIFGLAEFAGGEESFFRSILSFYRVGPADQIVRIVFSLIGILLVGWLVSIGFSLTQFYGFTLTRHPKGVAIDRGLFTRKQTVVPINRVSGVEIQANFLMRWLGMSSLTVRILGSKEEEEGGGKMMVSPWVATSRLEEMLQMVMPQATTKPGGWKRVPRRSIWRHLASTVLAYLVLALTLVVIGSFIYGLSPQKASIGELMTKISARAPWAANTVWSVLAALLVFSILNAVFMVFTSRARATEHTIEQQSGWLNRTWKMLPVARLQMAELDSSRLQRLFNLRSVQVQAPAMNLRSLDLDPEDAEAIFETARQKRRLIKSRGV